MTRPISVPDGDVRAHAATLRDLAGRVRIGQEAASFLHLDQGAYGVACQFLVDVFEPGTRATVGGLGTSVAELIRLAGVLEASAEGYDNAEAGARVLVVDPPLRLPL